MQALAEAAGVVSEGRGAPPARNRVWQLGMAYGLSDVEIAKATDANPRTVGRWRAQTDFERGSRYDARLTALLQVIDGLEAFLPKEMVRQWLTEPNRFLDGARPVNLLGAGLLDNVLQAVEQAREAIRNR